MPVILVRFNSNLIFTTEFRDILKYNISRKSVQWEPSSSMRTESKTDKEKKAGMTKLISAFRNFANAPKKGTFS